MRLSLQVTTGKAEGKVIPITVPQFFIGRDPQCHLRPNNPIISKRHCAVLVRADKAYVRDLDSTNGTFVNDERVTGERELHNDDLLKVGPLVFVARLETSVAVDKATPRPRPKDEAPDDEAVADLLLAMQDEEVAAKEDLKVDEVEGGSTILDLPRLSEAAEAGKPPIKKPQPPKSDGDTRKAAEEILAQMRRRR